MSQSHDAAYAPFLDSLHLTHRKRHIHKVTVTPGSGDTKFGYFLEVLIKPHRSRDYTLHLIFSTSSTTMAPNLITVKMTTYKGARPKPGALGDAMMLIAEIVGAWTTIAEEGGKHV